jgi:hypothetical protein
MDAVVGTKRRAEAAGLTTDDREAKIARIDASASVLIEATNADSAASGIPDSSLDAESDAKQKLEIQQQLQAVEEERAALLTGTCNLTFRAAAWVPPIPAASSASSCGSIYNVFIHAGKHGGYIMKCAIFGNRQVADVARAVTMKELQSNNTGALFEYAKYASEKVREDSQRKLYELMLQELDERAKTLQERLSGVSETRGEGQAVCRNA